MGDSNRNGSVRNRRFHPASIIPNISWTDHSKA